MPEPPKRRRPPRVTAACDLCKSRKVRCDGTRPCAYCARRDHTCTFSAPRARATTSSAARSPLPQTPPSIPVPTDPLPTPCQLPAFRPETEAPETPSLETDTAVPLAARLHTDPRGTAIFVGDCAPLSFLQTVRHLVASGAGPDGCADRAIARASVVEVGCDGREGEGEGEGVSFAVESSGVGRLVRGFFRGSRGLMELFDREGLEGEVLGWALGRGGGDRVAAAGWFLVLAIGAQEEDGDGRRAGRWFAHAREELVGEMCGNMRVGTVRGFALVALFMLRAFQANGAYLYFSLAARTAYAIGLHRTEVNASFGPTVHRERDRVWKSLRVMDMVVSNMLGRPPSTSDVDCTVRYHGPDVVPSDVSDISMSLLDASVQIFMIFERIVVEVYSRKRISLHIANYVSRQLKNWASRWLTPLHTVLSTTTDVAQKTDSIAACRIICSYYNCIMLLTRPFLIYDIYAHLGAPLRAPTTHADDQVKKEFADAAVEAATGCIDTLLRVVDSGNMPRRMPVIVSWLFMTSLVLAVSVMGRNGLSLEPHCRGSLRCLGYFAKVDPHARQYAETIQSLLDITRKHVQSVELRQRNDRRRISKKLFGLHSFSPEQAHRSRVTTRIDVDQTPATSGGATYPAADDPVATDWTIYDADFFTLPGVSENDLTLQDFLQPGRQTIEGSLADIPLFPMYDQMGPR